MIGLGVLRAYASKIRLFGRNARLYLFSLVLSGLAVGIFSLLFNFYILSLGYDEALLGQLITTSNTTALLTALPAGYLADLIGRKQSLVLAGLLSAGAILGLLGWQSVLGLYMLNIGLGLGQSLTDVTLGPFLMENSGEAERTYLFSLSFGVRILAAFGGNWLGGQIPQWAGQWLQVEATDAAAYATALILVVLLNGLALIPLLRLHSVPKQEVTPTDRLTPFRYARQHPVLLAQLISPMLLLSFGSGLFVPFMNLFFRDQHQQDDATIGFLVAWGSLVMAMGLLLAPPLADQLGKVKLILLTQALSIPFMVALGFAPWFWLSAAAYLVRIVLMNMTVPVYQAFVMEKVDQKARATVASLFSMSLSLGWAISPTLSGRLQVQAGFSPIFALAITLYISAIYLYWRFFGRNAAAPDTTFPV